MFSKLPRDVLEEKVGTLPPEICKIIMDFLFEDLFGPRKVHPNGDLPLTRTFLSLDKQLYNRYSNVYWSQSTWVVGKGPANESMRFMTLAPYNTHTTEFSQQKPNDAALRIRRVEFYFSVEDLQQPHITVMDEIKVSQNVGGLELVQDYRSDSKTLTADLMQIWQDKFDRIAFLELDHLTLDFTRAYAPDGAFLGNVVVQRFLPFFFRMPAQLKILAPTQILEDEIRGVLEDLNKHEAVVAA